ncbi:hypothetical protein QMZ92_09870 [Streptomyces sp. HNM0645]|uniref:hypothetical protein n=1 Tax=Streptomyces sp. HNM0645 TaxID=2782343 RepID=UPI0024B7BBCE|nr:hypothetical protein [Streptomyces sp. HNM0645]MDI9884693.1 hypothetical protein [Streptomyces sp. HNM0645]
MTQPTPARRPSIEHPGIPLTALAPLPAGPAAGQPDCSHEAFPLGPLSPYGRVGLWRQGPRPNGATRPLPVAASTPHAPQVPLGTNAIGSTGTRTVAGALPGSPLIRREPRRTGPTHRGAEALPAAVPDGSPRECTGRGPGLPRRGKRRHHQRLRPVSAPPAHRDPRAKGSVHR